MNGYLLIDEARAVGLSTAAIYRPYNTLYSAIRGFIDPDYFGVSAYDDELEEWVPKHVNSSLNPLPSRDFFGRPARRKFKKRDLLLHLAAEPKDRQQQFRFLVNSPKTFFHLLAFDIDGKEDQKTHDLTCDIYHDCFVADWDFGGNVYIERSRNRRGRYIWMIIERSSEPAVFNLTANALSRAMRGRYTVDKDNKFDAIKGTLHFDSRDDVERLFALYDNDINDDNRGVLVTMPLSGAVARRSFESEHLGFLEFLSKKKGRYLNAIPESHLRGLLERFSPDETERLDAEIIKLMAKREAKKDECQSAPTASLPSVGNTLRISASPSVQIEAREKLISKANAEISGKNRMRYVSCLYFYQHGQYAQTPDDLVAYYEAEGFAKGEATLGKHQQRLRRAADALAEHKNEPARKGRYVPEEWVDLVGRFVTDEVRNHPAVKYRSPRTKKPMLVETELLAAGLYLITTSAFAKNRADRMHTLGQQGQLDFYTALAARGLLTASFETKNKRVAVPVILQLAGLVVLRDARFCFGGDNKEKGICQKYGLGVNHPRFDEFVGAFGHVVDPKSAPVVASLLPSKAA